jgi:polar amino acid transport system substrate-binding protein
VIALPAAPVAQATSYDELRGARWGAVIGTTDLMYLETVLGVSDAAVYDDQIGVFQAMLAGQIDATLAALPTALFATAVQIPDAAITAILPADENDLGHGLLFQKDNPLVPWVDEALSAVIARGVVEDLKAQYLVANPDLPVITQ